MSKKKWVFGMLSLSIAAIVIYFLAVDYENKEYQERAFALIATVENHRVTHKVLPNNHEDLKDIPTIENDGPYYQKINDSIYEIFFTIGFDEAYVYNSAKKDWAYQNW
jgi:hypothetical protein